MKKNTILLMLLSLFVFSSCSKDDNKTNVTTPGVTQINLDFLYTGKWKLSALNINPGVIQGGEIVTDLYPNIALTPWLVDNTRQFFKDGSGIDDEGPKKLSTSDPQFRPIVWSTNTEKTKITITQIYPNTTYVSTFDILQLDASTFKLSLTQDGSKVGGGTSGTIYVTNYTYVH